MPIWRERSANGWPGDFHFLQIPPSEASAITPRAACSGARARPYLTYAEIHAPPSGDTLCARDVSLLGLANPAGTGCEIDPTRRPEAQEADRSAGRQPRTGPDTGLYLRDRPGERTGRRRRPD